ncbi:MAG: leucine-rich repeat domain-containing protein [Candidatus Hodarchaeales archaeon]
MNNEIIIKGKTDDGKEFNQSFPINIEVIDISDKNLVSIDLSDIQYSTSLETFILNNNKLQVLNLEPFEHCNLLEHINLGSNGIYDLDLSYFQSCTTIESIVLSNNNLKDVNLSVFQNFSSLELFDLSNNQIKTLDLTPLRSCIALEQFFLNDNELQVLDLNALKNCKSLWELQLQNNKLQFIDLSPLQFCEELDEINLTYNDLYEDDKVQWHVFFYSEQEISEKYKKGVLTVFSDPPSEINKWFNHNVSDIFIAVIKTTEDNLQFVIHENKEIVDNSKLLLRSYVQQKEMREFAEYVTTGSHRLVSFTELEQLASPLSKRKKIFNNLNEKKIQYGYIILGIIIVFGGIWAIEMIGGLETLFVEYEFLQWSFLIFLGFQLFQGVMIQSYVDNLIEKGKPVLTQFEKRIKVKITSFLTKIHADFGVVVGLVWMTTIYSLFNKSYPLQESLISTWDQVNSLILNWDFIRFRIQLPLVQLPALDQLINPLFLGDTGLLVRVITILIMFYAVYVGGYGVLIHPSKKKLRIEDGAKINWFERSALLIGLILAFLAIGFDKSILSQLPIDVFKVGILIGGFGYILNKREHSNGFLQTILVISLLYFILIIVNFLTQAFFVQNSFFVIILLLFWTILIFIFYLGSYPLKKKVPKFSVLYYLLRSNSDYHYVWKRGERNWLHRWLFTENDFLTVYRDSSQGRIIREVKKIYPLTLITISLVFVVIPVFLITFFSALSVKVLF